MTRESPDGSAAISLVPSKHKQKERLWLPRRRRRLCVPQLHRQSIRKRRSIYERRAAEQSVPVDQVGGVYAKEIMGKAPGGTWFLDASGNWTQK